MASAKSFMLSLPLAFLATMAVAQPASPAKEVTITITQPELLQIGGALSAMPYKDVAGLLAKLQKQFDDQAKAPDSPKAEEKKK